MYIPISIAAVFYQIAIGAIARNITIAKLWFDSMTLNILRLLLLWANMGKILQFERPS